MKSIDLVSRYRLQELDFQDRVKRKERQLLISKLETLRNHYINESNNATDEAMRLHYWYMAETVLSVSNGDSQLTGAYKWGTTIKTPFS